MERKLNVYTLCEKKNKVAVKKISYQLNLVECSKKTNLKKLKQYFLCISFV